MASGLICRACGAKALALNVRTALIHSPATVITGSDRRSFRDNAGTGKTTALFSRVIPMIRANGLDAGYFDLGANLKRKFNFKDDYFEALRQSLQLLDQKLTSPFDVFAIDDAYHAFQDREEGLGLATLSARIWRTISGSVDAGRQFIFITAYHPASGAFDKFLPGLPGSRLFLECPAIEFIRTEIPA